MLDDFDGLMGVADRLGTFFAAALILILVAAFVVPIFMRELRRPSGKESAVSDRELLEFMAEVRTSVKRIDRRLDHLTGKDEDE